VIEGDRIDGDLLLAGGPDYLIEKVESLLSKRLHSPIIKCTKNVFSLLEKSEKQQTNIWERLKHGNEIEQELVKQFENTKVGKFLKESLKPQPYSSISYECLDWLPQIDVKYVHQQVEKVPDLATDKYKVVSVCSEQDSDTVMYNMIFVLDETKRWFLLTSVDFAIHGEAESGHFHINRTPDSSMIEHWGLSNRIFHGSGSSSPIWWKLIPSDKKYHKSPVITLPKIKKTTS